MRSSKGLLSGKQEAAGSNPVQSTIPAEQISKRAGFVDKDWDIYNTKDQLQRQTQILSDWKTCKYNRQEMLHFIKKCEIEGIGVVQRPKYVYSFKSFLKVVNKDFRNVNERDIETFLYSLRNYKPSTKNGRWVGMRKFLRYIGKESVYKNLKPKFSANGRKLPEELLTEDEIKTLIKNVRGPRNKAIVSVLYESGCRIGELLTRRVKHVVFDRLGGVLILDGKTGMRRIRLVNSVPLLATWLAHHPLRDEPESFLWINQNDQKNPIKHRAVYKLLEETSQRVGIKKKVHPHLFRHSRATHLAKFLTEQELKIYFGWTGGSGMASIYVHLSGKDIEDKILEIHGMKQPEHKEEVLKPIMCPRCERENDSTARYCYRCGMMLLDCPQK